MSPEESAVDLAAANERLARMNLNAPDLSGTMQQEREQLLVRPPRRTRSDAGKPRPKSAPAETKQEAAGGLSDEDAKEIVQLTEHIEFAVKCEWQSIAALDRSREAVANTKKRLTDYLDSLRSVPRG